MAILVNLNDIIESLEFQSEFTKSFLNKKTGQVISVSDEELDCAEEKNFDLDDLPDWQKENVQVAKEWCEENNILYTENT